MKNSRPKTASFFLAQKKRKEDSPVDPSVEPPHSAPDKETSQRLVSRPNREKVREKPHDITPDTEPEKNTPFIPAGDPASHDPDPPAMSGTTDSLLDPSEVGVEKILPPKRSTGHGRKIRMGTSRRGGQRHGFLWFACIAGGLLVMAVLWSLVVPRAALEEPQPPEPSSEAPEDSGIPPVSMVLYGNDTGLPQRGREAERQRLGKSRELLAREGPLAALHAAESEAASEPNNAAAQHHAGVLAMAADKPLDARSYFLKALEANPRSSSSIYNLAQTEFALGNYAEAAKRFSEFREFDPTNRIAAYRSVVCAVLLGEQPVVDRVSLPEDSLPGIYARAAFAYAAGDVQQARDLLKRAEGIPLDMRTRYLSDMQLLGLE